MLDRLNDYDWEEAFGFASGEGKRGAASNWDVPVAVLGDDVDSAPFTREDVAEILAIVDGENDEESWIGVFRLHDGRYASLSAGCDYTGWDCQAGGSAFVSSTLDGILRFGLTEEERRRLGYPPLEELLTGLDKP